jgi:uncharacterized protein (DUF427 family)
MSGGTALICRDESKVQKNILEFHTNGGHGKSPSKFGEGKRLVRLPGVATVRKTLKVIFNGVVIAQACCFRQIREIDPFEVYFIHQRDVKLEYVTPGSRIRAYKLIGVAQYVSIEIAGRKLENAAWYFPEPTPAFSDFKYFIALNPYLMDSVYVNSSKIPVQQSSLNDTWTRGCSFNIGKKITV